MSGPAETFLEAAHAADAERRRKREAMPVITNPVPANPNRVLRALRREQRRRTRQTTIDDARAQADAEAKRDRKRQRNLDAAARRAAH